jgi:hypothetical protein
VERGDGRVQAALPQPATAAQLAGRCPQTLLHRRDVPAGAKGRPVAGQHQGHDVGIVGGAIEDLLELRPRELVDGIAYVGTVEHGHGHAP